MEYFVCIYEYRASKIHLHKQLFSEGSIRCLPYTLIWKSNIDFVRLTISEMFPLPTVVKFRMTHARFYIIILLNIILLNKKWSLRHSFFFLLPQPRDQRLVFVLIQEISESYQGGLRSDLPPPTCFDSPSWSAMDSVQKISDTLFRLGNLIEWVFPI